MNAPLMVLMSSCIVALAMAGVLFVISRSYPKSVRGLHDWSRGALVMSLGLPLLVARGHIPDFVSIVVANVLILAALMLMNAGTRRFVGIETRLSRPLLAAFVLSFTALFVWFTFVQPSLATRIGLVAAYSLVLIVDQLRLALQRMPRTAGRHLFVASLSIMAGGRAVRLATLGIFPPTSLFDPSASHFAYAAFPSIMIPFVTISLVMLASEKLRLDLEFTSRHDDLTHCLNKRAAMEALQREIARAERHGGALSIMLIDLDNFKHINDTYGHLEGDRVLVDFSTRAQAVLREPDQLSRFGGDEFMLVLPDTDPDEAAHVAARLHDAGSNGRPIAWTVSIGISNWHHEEDTPVTLLARADAALYKSKQAGRNQTQTI